jgi:hypothetical protein
MQISKKRVGVHPPEELTKRRLVFDSLAELFPVVFEAFFPDTSSPPDACVFLGQDHPVASRPVGPWRQRLREYSRHSYCVLRPYPIKYGSETNGEGRPAVESPRAAPAAKQCRIRVAFRQGIRNA